VGMAELTRAEDDLALVILPRDAIWSSFTQQLRRKAKQTGRDAKVVCSVRFDDGHRDVFVRLDGLGGLGGSWPRPMRAPVALLLRILSCRIWAPAVAEANPGFIPYTEHDGSGPTSLPTASDAEHVEVMAALRERLDDSYYPDGADVPVMRDEALFVALYEEELEVTRYTDGLPRSMRPRRGSQ